MEVCFGGPAIAPAGREGVTIGHIYFITAKNAKGITSDKIAHEKVHAKQWDKYGASFMAYYAMEGTNACTNGWETQAGLKNGNYDCT